RPTQARVLADIDDPHASLAKPPRDAILANLGAQWYVCDDHFVQPAFEGNDLASVGGVMRKDASLALPTSSKYGYRNPKQTQNSKSENKAAVDRWYYLAFVCGICLGLRASNFDFLGKAMPLMSITHNHDASTGFYTRLYRK